MTLQYKLTDCDGYTYDNTHWGPGAKFTTTGIPRELCTAGWLHCYSDPVLAVMLNPIHANFINPKLAIVECSGEHLTDSGLKEGWTLMEFVEWIELPVVTISQCIAFGILCAKEVYPELGWVTWADKWLNNTDRSYKAAANAAYNAAANAAYNANAAANAAYNANAAANAANAAYAAANAANAAYAAANTANAARVNLVTLAHKALELG